MSSACVDYVPSAWLHIFGGVGFAIFAICRPSGGNDVQHILTSLAAYSTSAVFFASSFYHVVSPDRFLSSFGRILDYSAIYTGITLSASADLAVLTKGFKNVPIVTIVDLPISCLVLIAFFALRRAQMTESSTWVEVEAIGVDNGLFNRAHEDLHHASLRKSTSLLICGSYFMSIPVALSVLGQDRSGLVLGLQIVAFVLLVSGMVVDRILEQGALLRFPSLGCMLNNHALWHAIAILSAALNIFARELALMAPPP